MVQSKIRKKKLPNKRIGIHRWLQWPTWNGVWCVWFIQAERYNKSPKKIPWYIEQNYQHSKVVFWAFVEFKGVKYDKRNDEWRAEPTVDKDGNISPQAKKSGN